MTTTSASLYRFWKTAWTYKNTNEHHIKSHHIIHASKKTRRFFLPSCPCYIPKVSKHMTLCNWFATVTRATSSYSKPRPLRGTLPLPCPSPSPLPRLTDLLSVDRLPQHDAEAEHVCWRSVRIVEHQLRCHVRIYVDNDKIELKKKNQLLHHVRIYVDNDNRGRI